MVALSLRGVSLHKLPPELCRVLISPAQVQNGQKVGSREKQERIKRVSQIVSRIIIFLSIHTYFKNKVLKMAPECLSVFCILAARLKSEPVLFGQWLASIK